MGFFGFGSKKKKEVNADSQNKNVEIKTETQNNKNKINTEYQNQIVQKVLSSAMRNVVYEGISILKNDKVYALLAISLLQQKMNRANTNAEYIQSLKNNIYYYANCTHRYAQFLRQIIPNSIPDEATCARLVDNMQVDARLEVRKNQINRNDGDSAVSVIKILKAEDLPDELKRIEALESIYAQLSVQSDVLIDTIGIISNPMNSNKLFSGHLDEIDGKLIMDRYFEILKRDLHMLAEKYPVFFTRQ